MKTLRHFHVSSVLRETNRVSNPVAPVRPTRGQSYLPVNRKTAAALVVATQRKDG